ncbi:MAG: ABC transporter permease subunit [Proteobacteria bacterium]|nr:ABC transporter permease subunit [Pseudomonadota bacterium]MDA0992317.1 ABC transporter permease subunit [Pseudomonadota bacterium]
MSALSSLVRHARSSRAVTVCATMLLVIAMISLIGPLISNHSYFAADFDNRMLAPTMTGGHFFGTDELGRDLLARTLSGIRVTLLVAVIASLVSLGIGVLYGAVAGYIGGRVDGFMMRIVDGLYALPFIFFVILLMVAFGRSMLLILIAIGAINWLDMARIVRGQTISLKQRAFVDAARLIGVSTRGIIFRHITPNLLGVVVVYMTLAIPQAILMESFLSFLGLGIQAPQTSLGALVSDGVSQMEQASWLLVIPAVALAVILLCFNFLGDGLRDLVDPKGNT